MGDLNIDWKDIYSSECHPWKELLVGFQLEQTIAEPKRAAETTSTLIELSLFYVCCLEAEIFPKATAYAYKV